MKYCCSDITSVKVLEDYNLYLQFADGSAGAIDIAKLVPFNGVFAALQDKEFFAGVHVNPDIGTICWDNGADLSPAYLHQNLDVTS